MMWAWGNGYWLMGFSMLLFWGGVAALIVWAVRSGGGSGGHGTSQAVRILEERYARGEIDHEEFVKRRAMLERS